MPHHTICSVRAYSGMQQLITAICSPAAIHPARLEARKVGGGATHENVEPAHMQLEWEVALLSALSASVSQTKRLGRANGTDGKDQVANCKNYCDLL